MRWCTYSTQDARPRVGLVDGGVAASVNGRQYSSGNFSAIYRDFARLVEHASRGTELRTGDVIGSGTVGTAAFSSGPARTAPATIRGSPRATW